MNIDMPGSRDIPQLRKLWQEAFGDSQEFLDGFFSAGYCEKRCLCLRMDGYPVAALYWFDCRLGDRKLAYLYAIATRKAYRGRGLCRQLMEQTHRHLKALSYDGAILVPAGEKLFSMYGAMGYQSFCSMQNHTVTAAEKPVEIKLLSAEGYFALRQQYLPEQGILQEDIGAYLATFTEFYGVDGAIMCLSREKDSLQFQEFLGDTRCLPGILAALGAKTAQVRLPGGAPYAMYLGFTGPLPENAYFGIPLG